MIAPASIVPAGDDALLASFDEIDAESLHRAARIAGGLEVVRACIVGHSSLLVTFDPGRHSAGTVRTELSRALDAESDDAPESVSETRLLRIPVSFAEADAPDLPALLRHAGITADEFHATIPAMRLRARYLGFAPGFAYLEGLPPAWDIPRRDTSRRTVPGGSFAIAGGMAGFYPRDSPGGWNLIGRTGVALWSPGANPPNRISAGDIVMIDRVEGVMPDAPHAHSEETSVWRGRPRPPFELQSVDARKGGRGRPRHTRESASTVTVVREGQGTLLVSAADEARFQFGLPVGGPFDSGAAEAANLAVGNEPGASLLECVLVGPDLLFHQPAVASWYGAEASLRVAGNVVRGVSQFPIPAGALLEVGALSRGVRGYLALRGGMIGGAGAEATGVRRVEKGSEIQILNDARDPLTRIATLRREERLLISVVAGPHDLTGTTLSALIEQEWVVTDAIDRKGIRLRVARGPAPFHGPADLRSCGSRFGTVQLHPNGDLVALGPDHPLTGGYLQPFTVTSSDRWKLGQLRPGDGVRWRVRG